MLESELVYVMVLFLLTPLPAIHACSLLSAHRTLQKMLTDDPDNRQAQDLKAAVEKVPHRHFVLSYPAPRLLISIFASRLLVSVTHSLFEFLTIAPDPLSSWNRRAGPAP